MANKKHNNPRASVPAGRKVSILVLPVLILTALAVCLYAFASHFPRLEVAGFRVTQEEYLRAMYRARNDVLSEHAAAGISLTDWSAETPLGDPCKKTLERTLELLTQYYAVSTLAVERGYLADAGFDAMVRDMDEINCQRQEALASGAMVTGIPQFTPDDYLTYRASSLRLQFCSDPNNPENQVTPQELRQRYEADKGNLYTLPDDLELSFLMIDTSPQEAQSLKSELEDLRQLALELGGLSLALEAHPQLKEHYAEISVDRGTYSAYARSHADILLCAEGLQTGDISLVFQQEGWLCLVECRQRIARNYSPLEDVQSVVLQSIREGRYDALIAQRAEEMEIDTDLQALYRFTAKQFH